MEPNNIDSKVFRQSTSNSITRIIDELTTAATSTTSQPFVVVDQHSSSYDMNKKHRGIAIVINHYKFAPRLYQDQIKERRGTHIDKSRLCNTLTKLGFNMIIWEDMKAKEISAKLEEVADMDHTNHDCIIVVVLTHGKEGKLEAYDCTYKENKIWKPFLSCRSLFGKPKLFFIQACRGNFCDKGHDVAVPVAVYESGQDEIDASPFATEFKTFSIPTTADLLIMHSTYIGHFSFRREETGTYFIQKLCDEFDENGNTQDLLPLLTSVCKHVGYGFESHSSKKPELHRLKQMPCIISTLTKKLIFTKKGESFVNENRQLEISDTD